MLKYYFLVIAVAISIFSCGTDKSDKNKEGKSSSSSSARLRKKIDRLDPKSFIELSIDLIKEKRKWQAEWLQFIKKKRVEYFASFGLNEDKFNRFSSRNQRAIKNFLDKNPRYNRLYMDANRLHRNYRQ